MRIKLNDDALDAIRGFLDSDAISPRFLNNLVQEYGDESIRVAFMIRPLCLLMLLSSRKIDRPAVGRVEISVSPGRLAPVHVLAADEALCGTDPFKGVEPVLVIRVTQVRVAPFLRRLDFLAEDFNPLRPGEPAGFRQAHG